MINKKIIQRAVPDDINLPDSIHPVLKRAYAARGIQSEKDLDYSLAALLPFEQLKGIDVAIDLLKHAINEKERVLIVADFDADGATSCALAMRGLSMLGIKDIVYVVPNRFEYGYGLSPEIVDVTLQYDPDLLITVDNGISSIKGVAHARQNGLKVLITDHHLPGQTLPEADAIVNPQLSGDQFQSKNLAGVGVMFYVLLALRSRLRETAWFEEQEIDCPNLARLLDLVALGTIADIVPLDKNNRIMVAHGLKLMQQKKTVPGITALLELAGRTITNITASDLGFTVAPRLNAAGRLTDMSLGIECLISDDYNAAKKMAAELNELNKERRQIQDEMQAQALLELENLIKQPAENIPRAICVYKPEWHQGVIGILAAKIKDVFNRPVIAFASESNHHEGNRIIKGSARSVKGLHIRDLLDQIASTYPDLILTFGGHAMAAGLTIYASRFDEFSSCLNKIIDIHASLEAMQDDLITDGQLSEDDFSLQLASDIQTAGPWGQGFPEPVFESHFKIVNKRIVGGNHLKLRLQFESKMFDAIAFNMTDQDWPPDSEEVFSIYRMGINEFRGNKQLQLLIEHIEPL